MLISELFKPESGMISAMYPLSRSSGKSGLSGAPRFRLVRRGAEAVIVSGLKHAMTRGVFRLFGCPEIATAI